MEILILFYCMNSIGQIWEKEEKNPSADNECEINNAEEWFLGKEKFAYEKKNAFGRQSTLFSVYLFY